MFVAILELLVYNLCHHRAISKVCPVYYLSAVTIKIHKNLLFNYGMTLIVFQLFVRLSGVTRNTEITFWYCQCQMHKNIETIVGKWALKRNTVQKAHQMSGLCCSNYSAFILVGSWPSSHPYKLWNLHLSCIICDIKRNKCLISCSKWKMWQTLHCNKTCWGILLKLLLKKCFMFTESWHFRVFTNLCWPKGEELPLCCS